MKSRKRSGGEGGSERATKPGGGGVRGHNGLAERAGRDLGEVCL